MIFTAMACGGGANYNAEGTYDAGLSGMEAAPKEAASADETIPITERKLIKEGRVEFKSKDLAETRKQVLHAVEKYKGYVAADNEYNETYRRGSSLTMRIPAADFEKFLAEVLAGAETVVSKDINARDVTEEFLDVTARLKTKKELETRYLELLKQAKSVAEILEIEKQANELRAEIESMEGRLKYLENQVTYSTISINFYIELEKEHEFGKKFIDGLGKGWQNLIWFFIGLAHLWPFVLIVIAGIFWLRRLAKRRRNQAKQ